MNIPLAQPDITQKEIDAVIRVLKSKRLSLGEWTEKFEKAVAQYAGVKYAIAVANGTCGLHLLMRTFGVADGDEVITTPFSFIASANCILFERAKSVFVDIDPLTLCIDPERIEEKITKKTKAILAVDIFGHPCDWGRLTAIAKKHNLTIIEDSCEALGSKFAIRNSQFANCGNFGDASVFAFYPNKQITTGEGGMIITNNAKIARLCRAMRNQGRLNYKWLQHDILGYNYRLDEMSAALGYAQMQRIGSILSKRTKVANLYYKKLQIMNSELRNNGLPEIQIPYVDKCAQVSWFVYVIRLSPKYTAKDRNNIILKLQRHGIACSNYFPPIHLQPFYQKLFWYKKGDFPITEAIAQRTIALPFYGQMAKKQVKYIVQTLTKIILSSKLNNG